MYWFSSSFLPADLDAFVYMSKNVHLPSFLLLRRAIVSIKCHNNKNKKRRGGSIRGKEEREKFFAHRARGNSHGREDSVNYTGNDLNGTEKKIVHTIHEKFVIIWRQNTLAVLSERLKS